jgi:hypothetical protein
MGRGASNDRPCAVRPRSTQLPHDRRGRPAAVRVMRHMRQSAQSWHGKQTMRSEQSQRANNSPAVNRVRDGT